MEPLSDTETVFPETVTSGSMELGRYWKTIVDMLQDGLIVVDTAGTIVAVNPAANRLTGYQNGEIIGRSCRLLNCSGCEIIGEGTGEKWCELFAVGGVRDKKCMITNKSGRRVYIIKSASVLKDESGQIIGAVETLTDLSESVRNRREIISLRNSCPSEDGFFGLVGKSPAMQSLYELIGNLAESETPVLIQGESGTGKELVARGIHESGLRREGPYIKVNCAALNENLFESELFGHVKGAFTGAGHQRIGRFEAAHGGTLFLDEIGDIPLSTQVKLLRVLEDQKIERVGDHTPISVDVRIITATNRDIETLIRNGRFREDFFYRINTFPIRCPSLSERAEDIPSIAHYFIRQNNAKTGKTISGLSSRAMLSLLQYSWPGNVRELRNAIEYAFVLCRNDIIDTAHLPQKVIQEANSNGKLIGEADNIPQSAETADNKAALIQALRETGGNRTKTAEILGISRVTVWKRIKKYGIELQTVLRNA